ncbi:MAG: ATP-binding protein [Opitutales bacterium]|nr:ATP-binding protein [Opitutales bacterium]
MPKLLRNILFAIVICASPLLSFTQQKDYVPKKIYFQSERVEILVIHSFTETALWNDTFNDVFEESMGQWSTNIFYEYLAAKQFWSPEYRQSVYELYKKKYSPESGFGNRPKLVVTVGQSAFDFVTEFSDLFSDLPIIFSGIIEYRNPDRKWEEVPNLTGMFNYNNFAKNFELIAQLHPDRKNIFAIFENSVDGTSEMSNAKNQLESIHIPQEVVFIHGAETTTEEMYQTLLAHEHDSAVLFMNWSRDANRALTPNPSVVAQLSENIDIPIYGTYISLLGKGIIGGYMVTPNSQASKTAEIVTQVIHGTPTYDIPVHQNNEQTLSFDYNQLKRWRIPMKSLPVGSTIINHPRNIWNDYREYVIWTLIVVTFLIIISISLSFGYTYKRRLERLRRESESLLKEKNQQLTWELDRSRILASELYDANKVKSNFLSIMSHELRTPLNPILGFTELLLEETSDEEHVGYLKDINQSGHTLVRLIDGILEYCRYERDQSEPTQEVIYIKEMIDHAVYPFEQKILEKKLSFKPNIPDQPTQIISDPKRIQQVITNLMSNAIKFTSEGSIELDIEVIELDADEYQLSVKVIDTGLGISEEARKTIFQPFSQIDNSNIRAFEGIGLGLAMCNEIAKGMKGTLEYESVPGNTVFEFCIPVRVPVIATQNRV